MTKENTASPVAKTSSENKKMNLYRSNGVPPAYSDMAEEVQRGREAKIAHLLKQVGNNGNDLLYVLYFLCMLAVGVIHSIVAFLHFFSTDKIV